MGSNIRANIIKGRKFEDQFSSVVDNTTSSSWENDLNTSETDSFTAASDGIKDSIAKDPLHKGVLLEFEKHKSFFSGPLLPYEVCLLLAIRCRCVKFSECIVLTSFNIVL
jgi:hypothetical protein